VTCAEQVRLTEEYEELVAELERIVDIGRLSGERLVRAQLAIETQREKCIAARERLAAHIIEHGC